MFVTLSVLALVACSASASVIGVNPNALNVPLDEAKVAIEKNHQLIQQASEGARNILGGGVPLALPADTHEVAAGKRAHAIAHATQAALTTAGHGAPLLATAVAGPAVVAAPAGAAWGAGVGLGASSLVAAPAAWGGVGLGASSVVAAPWGLRHGGVVESAPWGLALSRPGPLSLAAPHGIDGIPLRGLGLSLGGKGLWL